MSDCGMAKFGGRSDPRDGNEQGLMAPGSGGSGSPPRRSVRLTRGAAMVAVAMFACTTDPCACTPPGTFLLVFGQVETAVGAAAAGAEVRVDLAPRSCLFSATEPPFARATTTATGSFRTQPAPWPAGHLECMRVSAQLVTPTGFSEGRIEGILIPVRPQLITTDSIGVVIRLR